MSIAGKVAGLQRYHIFQMAITTALQYTCDVPCMRKCTVRAVAGIEKCGRRVNHSALHSNSSLSSP